MSLGFAVWPVLGFELSSAFAIGYFLHGRDSSSPRREDFILDHGLMLQSITGEEMAAGAGSSWSHSICGQEADLCLLVLGSLSPFCEVSIQLPSLIS